MRARSPGLRLFAALLVSAWVTTGCRAPGERADAARARAAVESAALPAPEVDEPTAASPVTMGLAIHPGSTSRDAGVMLLVEVHTAPTWHIHPTTAAGANAPTHLALVLPDGVEAAGERSLPAPVEDREGTGLIYEGELRFQVPLRVGADAARGERVIACRLSDQACDPFLCRPPESQVREVVLTVE